MFRFAVAAACVAAACAARHALTADTVRESITNAIQTHAEVYQVPVMKPSEPVGKSASPTPPLSPLVVVGLASLLMCDAVPLELGKCVATSRGLVG